MCRCGGCWELFVFLVGVAVVVRAEYFVTNQYPPAQWSYFDFGVPCYANFTSPIRRFADVLTHRALAQVLELESKSEVAVTAHRARAVELGIPVSTAADSAYFFGCAEVRRGGHEGGRLGGKGRRKGRREGRMRG